MKNFLCLIAICFATTQAFPDELLKLQPDTIVKAVEEVVPEVTTPEGVVSTTETTTESVETTTESVETTTEEWREPWRENRLRSQGTAADRTRLVNDLFKNYNKRVNPDEVKLGFGITLMNFAVIESKDILESYIWIAQDWTDQRLKWNPEDYGGVELIRTESDLVWKPDVTLYNTADPVNMLNCYDTNILLYSSGRIMWIPPCRATSYCHFNTEKEPYGENMCTLKFGSWTFDGNTLDVQFRNKTNPEIDVSHLMSTSEFEIVGNTAERNEIIYPCCVEPYPNLTFNLTLKRIPSDELFKKWY